ncbi:MAG: hypothetical protein IV100_27505 [Myxococcales bacterium]|nr:hypothetical protein [Myxococcales bacterium]
MINAATPVSPVTPASNAFPRCAMDNHASHDSGFASVLLRGRRDEGAAVARPPSWPVVTHGGEGGVQAAASDNGIRTMLTMLEQRANARIDLPTEGDAPDASLEAPVEMTYSETELRAHITEAVEAALRDRETRFEAERAESYEGGHAAGFAAGAASREPELEASLAQIGSAAAELQRTQESLRMAAIREALDLGLLVANTVVGLSLGDERAIEMGVRRVFEVTPERRGTIRCAPGAEESVNAALSAHRLDGRIDVRSATDLAPGVVRFEVTDGVIDSDPREIVAAITEAIRERLHVVPKAPVQLTSEVSPAHAEVSDAPAA